MPLVAFAAVLFASSTARVVLRDNDSISLTTNATSVPTAGAWVQVRWVASQTACNHTVTDMNMHINLGMCAPVCMMFAVASLSQWAIARTAAQSATVTIGTSFSLVMNSGTKTYR